MGAGVPDGFTPRPGAGGAVDAGSDHKGQSTGQRVPDDGKAPFSDGLGDRPEERGLPAAERALLRPPGCL